MENIVVTSVSFDIERNSVLHRTDRYILTKKGTNVLRRGQLFHLVVSTNRPFKWDHDSIKLEFNFGPDPRTTRNTKGLVNIGSHQDEKTESGWSLLDNSEIQSDTNGQNKLHLEVRSPSNIPVGLWLLQAQQKLAVPVYFLFNPWCKEDTVYMPNTDNLDEYVLEDVGKIWVGAIGSCRGREWVFGQFDKYVLPACMLLFERAKIHPTTRGNPVRVARSISKLVNANDDRGVLVGKWNTPYTGGTPPAAWTGSAAILREYAQSGGTPVRYGQCWVFAAVVATLCRAIGLPCRVVSNLVSAHDANASLTIDRYYDENLNAICSPDAESNGDDSIWNFHVWNDVWMARPDLPTGYGGWQAIDATPQETSDGYFQCGPASLYAIRTGEIGHLYDGAFIYASVNADLIRWKEDKSSDFGYIRIQTFKDHIGKMIFTKKPFLFDPNGDRDREDITDQYKPKEGTTNERIIAYNAVGKSNEAKKFYQIPDKDTSDVEFILKTLDRIMIGDNYDITLIISNSSSCERNVKTLLTSTSVFYTGVSAHQVKSASLQVTMAPNSREELNLTVSVDEYLPLLVEYGIMKIGAICSVCETNQTWAAEDDFQVLKPSVIIKILDTSVQALKLCRIQFQIPNPLNKVLKECVLTCEIAGLVKSKTLNVSDVPGNQSAEINYSFIPKRKGTYRIVATFFSKQLYDVSGAATLNVL